MAHSLAIIVFICFRKMISKGAKLGKKLILEDRETKNYNLLRKTDRIRPQCLLVHQFAITDALRLLQSQSLGLIGFILRITSLKIEHISLSLKGENMCAYSV